MSWTGPGVNLDAWYVTGHSNGGQGSWFTLTHSPDKVKAAAPVSGYSSIEKYVPYVFWHEADPAVMSIIRKSLSNYRHELLLGNAKGIPILQQHGSDDENVPVYHSRRLYQLLRQSGISTKYNELVGKRHWYEGIMVTPALRAFYENISSHDAEEERLPKNFSIVTPCTGRVGPKGGIVAEQLISPDQEGCIDVHRDGNRVWELKTANIRRLRLDVLVLKDKSASCVNVDKCNFLLQELPTGDFCWLLKAPDGSWKVWLSFLQALTDH